MSKILTCNLKTVAFREFCLNMLFSYFSVSYNIVKLQSFLHSRVIATLRFSLLSKSINYCNLKTVAIVLITHLLLVLEV